MLNKAFQDQTQQWKNRKARHPKDTPNPKLARQLLKLGKGKEVPRSPIPEAVVKLHNRMPKLDDNGIARHLNANGQFDRVITRDYVKHIRKRYEHLWKPS